MMSSEEVKQDLRDETTVEVIKCALGADGKNKVNDVYIEELKTGNPLLFPRDIKEGMIIKISCIGYFPHLSSGETSFTIQFRVINHEITPLNDFCEVRGIHEKEKREKVIHQQLIDNYGREIAKALHDEIESKRRERAFDWLH